MPNANVCIYLTDEEYLIYRKDKTKYNKNVREFLKEEIKNDI